MTNISLYIDSVWLFSHITYFTSIAEDLFYTHIYSIIAVSSLTIIILYSGAANRLGQRLIGYIGVGAGVATIYSGSKELFNDVKSLIDKGTKPVESTSKPSGSSPSGSSPTPSDSSPSPSGSSPSSNKPA